MADKIQAAAGEVFFRTHGSGSQIYVCSHGSGRQAIAWNIKAPQAGLRDQQGRPWPALCRPHVKDNDAGHGQAWAGRFPDADSFRRLWFSVTGRPERRVLGRISQYFSESIPRAGSSPCRGRVRTPRAEVKSGYSPLLYSTRRKIEFGTAGWKSREKLWLGLPRVRVLEACSSARQPDGYKYGADLRHFSAPWLTVGS